jgi:hypothetical protein
MTGHLSRTLGGTGRDNKDQPPFIAQRRPALSELLGAGHLCESPPAHALRTTSSSPASSTAD